MGIELLELKSRVAARFSQWKQMRQHFDEGPEQSEPMPVPRGKVVGGTSAINGQVILRGVPEDYDSWAEMGNDES